MRWLMLAVLATAMQTVAQPPTASETVDVTVIEMDVVVVDASGKPVRGLTREDFELSVGGRKRPISNFYAIDAATTERSAHPATVRAIAAPPRRSYLVLFVDDLHLQQGEKKRVLDSLRKFVARNVGRGTAAMLAVSNGNLAVKQAFTEDPQLLIRAVHDLERQPARIDDYESDRRELVRRLDTESSETILIFRQQMLTFVERERSRTERTMAELREVLRALSGLDGRRVLVYVSDGLPMQPGVEMIDHYKPDLHVGNGTSSIANQAMANFNQLDALSTSLAPDFQKLATDAASAGVQFFAIDATGARGFVSSVADNSVKGELNWSLIRSNLHAPIQLLADETGGRAIIDSNDFDSAFVELGDHLSTYYSLGFRSDGSRQQQSVQVRVRRPGLSVKAARSIREHTYREQIEAGVRSRLYANDERNPLHAALTTTDVQRGGEVGLAISVPAEALSVLPNGNGEAAAFDVYVAMLDDSMRESPLRVIRHKLGPQDSGDAVQYIVLRAQPGKYAVSVAVVDAYSWQTSYFQRTVELAEH